ncbi:hypothetical protein ACIQRS_25195 [Streptomyces termitum]|uniref:Uncharacterized protein n=1 Tax=Streptomyces termitum TaxID=67368 RepID=A0A918WAF1_9ACTN|nr:hypothetical protein [Streptomyces termitum]GHA97546.1 hypothetical protein GCM10010305_46420 [Streptomyces termitum]
MTWQWTGLALFSLTVLPAGVAMATNRVPERLRHRLAPVRPRGRALLLIYATAPFNALPRMTGASPDLTLACTAAGGLLAVAGFLALGLTTRTHRHRPVATPHEGS